MTIGDRVTVLRPRSAPPLRCTVAALDTRPFQQLDATVYPEKRFVARDHGDGSELYVYYSDEGLRWAPGWDTEEADALIVANAL